MATVPKTTSPDTNVQLSKVQWLGFTANGDVGDPIAMGNWSDRSVQVTGAFGTSGEITIQGSNDGGTTWAPLTDPQGNNLVFTATKLEAITELPELIRPACTAGSGTIDLDVHLFMRGNPNG